MPQKQIIEYIKKARAARMTDEAIQNALLGAGWPQAEVDEAFSVGIIPAGERSKIVIVAAVVLVVLVLAGAAFAYWYLIYRSQQQVLLKISPATSTTETQQ